MISLQASAARLAREMEAPAQAEDDLRRLDIGESAAMAAWARTGAGESPKPDEARRETLNRALSNARAIATSAEKAKSEVESEYVVEANKLPGKAAWANATVAQILCETAGPLMSDLIEAQREIADKMEQIVQIAEHVRSIAEKLPAGSDVARQTHVALAELHGNMQKAFAKPNPTLEVSAESRGKLREFVSNLAVDSSVMLGTV
jgi:hypothetical protein